ncbi:ATP-binding cassette domain-containing protein [Peribacillus frigoritolerans]
MNKVYKLPIIVIGMLFIVAFIGPFFVPFDPFSYDATSFLNPSANHWLGTNRLGQDILSQLIYGTRTSILIGLCIAASSTILVVVLGLLAGYFPILDKAINGVANVLLVLPNLLLILIIISFTGGGMAQLVIILSLLSWPSYMRIVRSAVLTLKEREFVKASHLFGGNSLYILRAHILPHLRPIVKTKFILTCKSAILTEAGLAFLGLGDPNFISWGSMLNEAFSQPAIFLNSSWTWIVIPPVLLLTILTMSLAFLLEEKTKKPSKLKKVTIDTIQNEVDDLAAYHVNIAFEKKKVVSDVSFQIKSGEIVSLIGPSGSGKTTLARAMYGLLPADAWSGDIQYDGQSVRNPQFANECYWKTCAYIYQDARSAFNPLLKLKDQFLEIGITMDQSIAAVEEVSLSKDILEKYPHECSGGMLSRALIALAFANKPKFIIADECTSALDPILKKEIVLLLEEKVRAYNISLLFITHDMDVAYAISDRTLSIVEGLVEEEVLFNARGSQFM